MRRVQPYGWENEDEVLTIGKIYFDAINQVRDPLHARRSKDDIVEVIQKLAKAKGIIE